MVLALGGILCAAVVSWQVWVLVAREESAAAEAAAVGRVYEWWGLLALAAVALLVLVVRRLTKR